MDNKNGYIIPSEYCAICGKTLDEIGGKRIVATKSKNMNLSDRSPDGSIPWSCQKCAGKVCDYCGEPLRIPMGADILLDDGTTSYIALFPTDPGCINPNCEKYRG